MAVSVPHHAVRGHGERHEMFATRVKDMSGTRMVALVALLMLVLSVAACSSDPADDSSGDPDAAPTTGQDADPDDAQDDPPAAERPAGFPDEMPVPDYASYAFTIDPHDFFQMEMPVADVISDMERLLTEHGWEIVNRTEQLAWGNDVLFRVSGHGHDMEVYIEPAAGSETETQIAYGPGGTLLD
jgi:hypothetical protein